MFLNPKILKKLLKEAYKHRSLYLACKTESLYIAAGYWEMEFLKEYIPKETLGDIVALSGMLPEDGQRYQVLESGNQLETGLPLEIKKYVDMRPTEVTNWLNVYAKAIKSKVSYGIKAGLKSVKKKTKNLLGSSKTTLLKANQNRQYEDMASKAIDKYKTTINKKVSSTTKSLKKKVDAVTKSYQKKYKKNAKLKKAYTNAGKGLKEKITKKIKAQGNAAIKAVDKTLTALGKKYQKKYDAIASDRSNFLSKMSDYGDLFKSDDYGFISLVNFKSQTNQINALAKNMEHLKKVLPYNMMKDIQALDHSYKIY